MPKDPKLCIIDGCNRVRSTALCCQKHYRAFKLYGDPLKLKIILMVMSVNIQAVI